MRSTTRGWPRTSAFIAAWRARIEFPERSSYPAEIIWINRHWSGSSSLPFGAFHIGRRLGNVELRPRRPAARPPAVTRATVWVAIISSRPSERGRRGSPTSRCASRRRRWRSDRARRRALPAVGDPARIACRRCGEFAGAQSRPMHEGPADGAPGSRSRARRRSGGRGGRRGDVEPALPDHVQRDVEDDEQADPGDPAVAAEQPRDEGRRRRPSARPTARARRSAPRDDRCAAPATASTLSSDIDTSAMMIWVTACRSVLRRAGAADRPVARRGPRPASASTRRLLLALR